MADTPTRLDRIAGGLLGVHAGDSLGATVEFMSWEEIREEHPGGVRDIVGGGPFRWAPGAATDDTDLTRAVLLAYLDPGDDVLRAAADRMLAWYRGDWPGRKPGERPKDVGGATASGLDAYSRSGDPRRAGAGENSAGNGSLMRCIPTALAVGDAGRRAVEAREISAVTHDDRRCLDACAAYVEIAAGLLAGAAATEAVEAGAAAVPAAVEVRAALSAGREFTAGHLAEHGPDVLPHRGRGYVLDSLTIAVAAVLDPRPLEDVLVDVVSSGGDTDTNAAIAGGLLGVRDGAGAIPERWVTKLQFREEFTGAAARLAGP